jgi:hypothetical protein
MRELIPLNILTRLHLLVVLAACEGIWGIKMLQPSGRAAFRALLGPNRKVTAGELATGMRTFYRTLLRDRSVDTAFKAMNDAVDPTKPAFNRISAEGAFKMVWTGYRKDVCTPKKMRARTKEAVKQMAAKRLADTGNVATLAETERFARFFRERLDDHELHFETVRREFFLIDLYPENDARFDLKLKDCRPER